MPRTNNDSIDSGAPVHIDAALLEAERRTLNSAVGTVTTGAPTPCKRLQATGLMIVFDSESRLRYLDRYRLLVDSHGVEGLAPGGAIVAGWHGKSRYREAPSWHRRDSSP